MSKLVVSTIKTITSGRVENDDNVTRVETWECFAEDLRKFQVGCISFRNLDLCNFILLAPRRGCLLSPQSVGVLPSGELT